MSLFHVAQRCGNALHRHGALGGVGARKSVNRNEIGAHGCDVVEHHIHHHLEIGAIFSHYFNEHNAIEGAEGVVRHRDKPAFFG